LGIQLAISPPQEILTNFNDVNVSELTDCLFCSIARCPSLKKPATPLIIRTENPDRVVTFINGIGGQDLANDK
jgi:hypothetical protein